MPSNNTVMYQWCAELQTDGAPAWANGTARGPEGYTTDDAYRDACSAMAERGLHHLLGSFVIRPAHG